MSLRLTLLLAFTGVLYLPAPAQPVPDSGDVVLNEIMYAPSPSSNEYVELYNRSSSTIDLSNLEWADGNRSFTALGTESSELSPGDYAVLVRDPKAFTNAFNVSDYLTPPDWPALNNGGDTVILRHAPSGSVLDAVPYDPSWGGDEGNSLERVDPAGPPNRASNFGTSTASAGGTPGRQNSIYNPDRTPPRLTEARAPAGGDSLIVQFSEPLAPSSVSASAFRLESAQAPAIVSASLQSDPSVVRCALSPPLEPGTYTLVASDVSDRRGNVQSRTTAQVSYFEATTPSPGDLVVNEIQFAPPAASSEFIEIYNRSDKTVDLSTLRYADEDQDFAPVTTRRAPLHPDGYVVLARDTAALHATHPDVSARQPSGWDALNNGGDTVILRHAPSGTRIDAVPYEPSWGGADQPSLERIDPAGPSDAASNFGSSQAAAGATPGRQNSIYAPDTTAPRPRFAEQRDAKTLAVYFDEPLHPPSVTAAAFELPETVATNASLRRDSIAVLTVADSVTGSSLTVEGVQDRSENTQSGATIRLNGPLNDGALSITEIMYDPQADDYDNEPNQVEYVEVYNPTERRLSLRGLTLTDRPDEDGEADTLRTNQLESIAAGQYGVIAAAPNGVASPDSTQLARAFSEAPLGADSVAVLLIPASDLGLTNEGDRIRLHRADGQAITTVTYSPDWHADALETTSGTALARISPDSNPNAPDNWSSSAAPNGGTPGQRNAVSLSPTADSPEQGLRIRPSPFSVERDGATRIRYRLAEAPSLVRVRIFDARGRKVRTLEDTRLVGRTGSLVWDGRDDAGDRVRVGIYVVLFEAIRAEAGTIARFKEPVVVARPLN